MRDTKPEPRFRFCATPEPGKKPSVFFPVLATPTQPAAGRENLAAVRIAESGAAQAPRPPPVATPSATGRTKQVPHPKSQPRFPRLPIIRLRELCLPSPLEATGRGVWPGR